MDKIRFTANTGRKKIILGMGIALCHGENAWSEEIVRRYINEEIIRQFDIQFVDKATANTTAQSAQPKQEPDIEVDQELVKNNEVIEHVLEERQNIDDNILLSPIRFTKLSKERAIELVEKIDDVAKLKKLYEELSGFMGSRVYKRIVSDRIEALENTKE